jgi:hypothetical protein
VERFLELLAEAGVPAVSYAKDELADEVETSLHFVSGAPRDVRS